MNSPFTILTLLLVTGLTACDKQTGPPQAEMNAQTRQKAFEVRAAADKIAAALKEAAALDKAARKKAATQHALAAEPAPTPPK